MVRNPKFVMSPVAAAVGTALLLGATQAAVAQDPIEEVVVTGIRSSLQTSMNIKRDSHGVVDAITAEDIGKFPDTNLAESLQRITGVSISRVNGEGSQVTVRGFGAQNNMITLNGREIPAASTFGGGSGAGGTWGGATRAFDFANLASESVRAVEVFKTGRADIATGGIGATINIITGRPFDNPGLHTSLGIKAVHDTTNRTGDDLTPEFSGLFSWTDDNEKFGVSLTASLQDRDSGTSGSAINDWNIGTWGEDTLYSMAPGGVIENAPAAGQLYARPNDLRYSFSDTTRERTNAQLVLQFRPMENFTATADYTYAENDISERRGEATIWFANGNSHDRVVFDDSPVASPILISENVSGKDHGFEQQLREQHNELSSLGLNLEWDVNDAFSLALDVADSTMESLPSGPGNSGEIAFSMGGPVLTSQIVNWNNGLPTYQFVVDDSAPGRGNDNGVLDIPDMGSQVLRVFYAGQTTDITQVRLEGSFQVDDGRFDFGIESRAMETVQQDSNRYMGLGDWGIANPGELTGGLIQDFDLAAQFDDYNASASSQVGFRGNAEDLGQWGVDTYGTPANGYVLAYNPNLSNNNKVKEDIFAAYVQIEMPGQFGGMDTNMMIGLRYEKTDSTSTTDLLPPLYLLWQDNNDFQTVRDTSVLNFAVDNNYDNLLPSFDFDIMLRDDLKGRFSYSKTISRPLYGDLFSTVSNFGRIGSTLNGTIATATASNPQLVPLESDNFDLSVEWYYGEASYASVGLYEKLVENFVGTEQVDETHFGILDQTGGPRADAAAAALANAGFALDDTSLFVMMAILENPADFPTGAAAYDGTAQQAIDVATAYDIVPQAGDPEMIFRTSKPVNNKEAKIYGAEFALQHFFGDTGFGFQANYTLVRGDVGFDDTGDPGIAQFALTGLSDTANVVAIYENYGWQARLAWNWRDQYLDRVNRGNSRNPTYIEEYYQIDLNLTYLVNEKLAVFFEGLNLTGENNRQHGRSDLQLWYLEDLGSRYQIGARYTFD